MARPRLPLLLLLLALLPLVAAAFRVGRPTSSSSGSGRRPFFHHHHKQQWRQLPLFSSSGAAVAAAALPLTPHAETAAAVAAAPLPSIRGGGGGPQTGRRSVRAAVGALAKQLVTKHFLVAGMVVSIALAALNPSIGRVGGPLRPEVSVNVVGVSLIFLLSGLLLPLSSLEAAVKDYKLNASIQGFNLGFGPLLGLLFQAILLAARVDPRLATGLLIVSCLPTTINMCIVLATAANACRATAVFNAVLASFLGVFVAPATIFLTVGVAAVNIPYLDVVKKLIYKVLFPVLLGVTLRDRIPPLRSVLQSPKAKLPLKLATESILISIIYTTFCQSFLTGLAVTGRDLVALALSVPAFHLISLLLMFVLARAVTPGNRAAQVAAAFTGSQKTLALGMPLIKTIFETSPSLAHYAAPLLFIHPTQLVLGSLLVPFFQRYIEGTSLSPSPQPASPPAQPAAETSTAVVEEEKRYIPSAWKEALRTYFPRSKSNGYVYVLRLEGNRFYVGQTQDVSRRLQQHFSGNGAKWTQMHRPLEVVEVVEGGTDLERLKTLEVMKKHGWATTRGSYWSARDLRGPPRELNFIT